MKKIISAILVVILLTLGLFILTGCNKGYNKEVETYTIEKEKAKVSFEFAKDLGYEATQSQSKIELYNAENLSRLNIRVYYDYPASSNITKDEKSFYSDSYQDYKKETIGEYEGWSIYKRAELLTNYEINLKLTKQNEDKKVYAIDINVEQSPLEKGKSFNTDEFVNSEDFQHLLNSIKIEVPGTENEAE